MGKEILTFGILKLKKINFTAIIPIFLNNVQYLVAKKTISTLLVTCTIIIILNYYIKCFLKQALMEKSYDVQAKWMYFLIEGDDFLEKYNLILDKVSNDIKKEFDSNLSIIKFIENQHKISW